ncbi:phytanoyl-CoA dioxygenase family protein [Sulfurimonas sp. NW7]|uniref:phytanoyl-CoA dioxygenase family protein n=1 Tax=Sulfurimonas sp. NW7 TaxID=2922727 RepID=UPI003DA82CB4
MFDFTNMTLSKPFTEKDVADTIVKYGFVILPEFFSKEEVDAIYSDHSDVMNLPVSLTDKIDFGNGEMAQVKRRTLEKHDKGFKHLLKHFYSDFSITVTKEYFKHYNIEIDDKNVLNQFEVEDDFKKGKSLGSDLHYDRVPALKMCLYLDDTTQANGALRIVPRSHARTRNIALSQYKNNSNSLYQKNFLKEEDLVASHPIEGKAGSVVFLDTYCLHGGGKLTENTRRRVIRGISWAIPLLSSYFDTEKILETDQFSFSKESFFHPRPVPENQTIESDFLFIK